MKLSVHKPLGPSSIPAWALRDGCSELVEPLTMIFNSFISQSSFPTLFKKTIVTPVYKKDDPENPDNYRPISITGAISKVFEKLLHNQIETYVNEQKLYTPTQFGFRKNFSSIDALLYCTEKFRCYLDENLFVAAVMLDLSKAFDSINHEILTHKLNLLGFSSSACNLITSFLDQRIQKPVVNIYESDWIELHQWVPQEQYLVHYFSISTLSI